MTPVHYSSKTPEWSTPPALFATLDAEFGFTLDACATGDNAQCNRFYSAEEDGLAQPWEGVVWMNPPYGYGIGAWVRKACHSAWQGATVVCLLPAKTETRWWHSYVLHAAEIRFLAGRIRFGGCNVNAPFPSAVVVFTPRRPMSSTPAIRWYATSRDERGFTTGAA